MRLLPTDLAAVNAFQTIDISHLSIHRHIRLQRYHAVLTTSYSLPGGELQGSTSQGGAKGLQGPNLPCLEAATAASCDR